MGGILSPTCTDLHLATLLKIILETFQYTENIKLHCQYRDDGFIVFSAGNDQIKEFFNIANRIDPLLKFTFEVSNNVMTFLDTKIYKGTRFLEHRILDVKSHTKSTETYQYLQPSSAHPIHTFKSITVGETIRHVRNNSSKKELKKHLDNLHQKLIKRGYKSKKTLKLINEVKNKIDRKKTLMTVSKNKSIPLTFITKYNPVVKGLSRILRKHWNKLVADDKCKEIFKQMPIIAYKRNKNLKEIFAKTKR